MRLFRDFPLVISLITFYCVLNNSAQGQNTFELLLKNPADENLFHACESTDGYIFVGDRGHWSPACRPLLIETDKAGNIRQNKEYPIVDSLSMFFSILQYQENAPIIIEAIAPDPVSGDLTLIRFNKIDSSFNRTYTKLFAMPADYRIASCKARIINNQIVIFGFNYSIDQITPRPYILIFDMEGNLLKQNMFENHYGLVYDLLMTPDSQSYLLFVAGFGGSTTGGIFKLDTNLVLDTIYAMPLNIEFRTNGKWLTTNTLLIAGDLSVPDKEITEDREDRDLAITTTDSIFNSGYHTYLGKVDTFDVAGSLYSLDFITPKEIFFAGTANMDLLPFIDIPSWYMLNSLDSNLNLNWQKYYGGDAYYNLWGMLATQDGGCLMYGTRYDAATQNEERDLYILKVDENGLYTGIEESPGKQAHDAIIYPNPGCNDLNIQSGPQISGAQFTLYDMKGNSLLEEKINTTEIRINTSKLPPGIYPWNIVFKNKVVESGKWVKE